MRNIKYKDEMKVSILFQDGEKERFKAFLANNALKAGGYVRLLILEALDKAQQAQSGTGA